MTTPASSAPRTKPSSSSRPDSHAHVNSWTWRLVGPYLLWSAHLSSRTCPLLGGALGSCKDIPLSHSLGSFQQGHLERMLSIWAEVDLSVRHIRNKNRIYKEFHCVGTFGVLNCHYWFCLDWAFPMRKNGPVRSSCCSKLTQARLWRWSKGQSSCSPSIPWALLPGASITTQL